MKKLAIVIASMFLCAAMFAQTQTVRAFSHRGGRLEFDENTLSAFEASRDAGYNGFETDIRMTKDGYLIINHDHTLERTTNGTGILEEKTLKELLALETKGGHKLMTLDELMKFLKTCRQDGLYVEFELKTKPVELYPQERLEEYCDKLYKTVMKNKPEGAFYLFTSSDYRGLRYLMSKYGAECLMITSDPINDTSIALAKALGIKRIGATTDGTSRKMVEKAHKEGMIVSLWPTHKIEDFVLACYLGADYLCTDIPIETMKTMSEKFPWINVIY